MRKGDVRACLVRGVYDPMPLRSYTEVAHHPWRKLNALRLHQRQQHLQHVVCKQPMLLWGDVSARPWRRLHTLTAATTTEFQSACARIRTRRCQQLQCHKIMRPQT